MTTWYPHPFDYYYYLSSKRYSECMLVILFDIHAWTGGGPGGMSSQPPQGLDVNEFIRHVRAIMAIPI